MAIKNPAFGSYIIDDDPADRTNRVEVADGRTNVEQQVLKNITRIRTPGYPISSGYFQSTRTKTGNEIIIDEGHVKTLWMSPPGPCQDDYRRQELCDGLVPFCEPYRPVSRKEAEKGYTPTGCKAFQRCQRMWKKKVAKAGQPGFLFL